MRYPIIVLGIFFFAPLAGCANFTDRQFYDVEVVNHTSHSITDTYIRLGSHVQWAGGLVFANSEGGGVSLDVTRLPNDAVFWWKWGDVDKQPPFRAELTLPALPNLPEHVDRFGYDLRIHVHPDLRVIAEIRAPYVDTSYEHQSVHTFGPLSGNFTQEQSYQPNEWE